MANKGLTNKRAKLLAELEFIVGSQCYNDNIQNWGPHGSYEGEGRDFRYPLTLIDETGTKRKRRNKADEDDPSILSTGYYAFGANRLHIIKALDELVSYLEREHGLRL